MKESAAIEISLSLTSLCTFRILSVVYFIYTLLTASFSNMNTSVCWEASIVAVICYGFIAVRKFMENVHFQNLTLFNSQILLIETVSEIIFG